MKKNILLVVNPISGAIDKSEFIEAVTFFATQENLNLIIYSTSGKDDIEKIQALYTLHQPQRILIAGGDGTIKIVAEAMKEKDVILGILPAGSANGLATDLDLPLALEESIVLAFSEHYIEVDAISINGEMCLHLSDIGLNADLIKNYEKSSVKGKLGYVIQAFNTLIDLGDPFTATIVANNKKLISNARMIVIANATKYGTGVVINPNGIINDGKFELVILKNLDLFVFAEIITGNIPINSEDVEVISTDKATITTNFRVSLQIDGEYCGTVNQLDITTLSKHIKIAMK